MNSLIAITILFVLGSFQSQVFAQNDEIEQMFPDWVKQSTIFWIDGKISDLEFLGLIENILNKNILPEEIESEENLKYSAQTVVGNVPELNQVKNSELIPRWVKDRAIWWIEGKITDEQFLRTVHYLREMGYLEYEYEKNLFSNEETFHSSLERFLLNDKEILNILKVTKWRSFATEYEFEEKEGVIDSVKITFTDITRVYEPIFYKFKVPTMSMQISEFNNEKDLENYWNSFEGRDKQTIFNSAHLTGNPNDNSECLFNYTSEGAITSCTYDNMIIQVIIYDQHNEHYNYDSEDLILDGTEPTSRFAGEILKKISDKKNHLVNNQLHQVLQNNNKNPKYIPKSIEPEKSITQGIDNFSCMNDDFGLVTVSGKYHNDSIKREQISLVITFFDNEENIMGKSRTSLYDINEFESKRFVGHTKLDKNFRSCQVSIE
ncbi:hypothetical protein [Nitrosopumilus sp.]|uniref:hypothetical protein n=1 Tax=Nitrosopumilus sp. TaxID=2024843 RepID=UPI0026057C56|nr:hypothetical protein [Nitrosopumilus sp.]